MPKRKSTNPLGAVSEPAESREAVAYSAVPQEPPVTPRCGHINRQSIGVDGQPDNCSCFLEKGHKGPHKGKHIMRTHVHKVEEKRIVGEVSTDIETEAEWLDGASVPFGETPPVKEIPPKSLAEQEFGINAASVMKGL